MSVVLPLRYDVAAFGRLYVDLYGEQIGAGLAGAIVASRLLCAPAGPAAGELEAFLAGDRAALAHLHRAATRRPAPAELRAAFGSPPAAKIQLPKRVPISSQVAKAVSATNQTTETGTPCTEGWPFGSVAIMPCAVIQANSPVSVSPEKK